MTGPGRVLVVGLDAVDPDIALDLVGDGRMPTLGSLISRGFCAPLATPPGLFVGRGLADDDNRCLTGSPRPLLHAELRPGTYEIHRVGGSVRP